MGRHTEATATCDRAPFQRVEDKKRTGNIVLWTGAAVAGAGAYTYQSGNSVGLPMILGGLGGAIVGGYMKNSAEDPDAVDRAVESLKIGETRSTDVAACMGRPSSTTTHNTNEETWTYSVVSRHSTGGPALYLVPVVGSLLASGTKTDMRNVTLTFKNGVLTDVSKTSTGF